MSDGRVLIVGATGHVGSQVAKLLLQKGCPVRVMVRREGTSIHGATGDLQYVLGDLSDPASLRRAVTDVDIIVSSANSIIPSGKTLSVKRINDSGYENLITAAEEAGVQQFVQSSVPKHPMEQTVPELAGKRLIEQRLQSSPIASTIIRNPAFMDVWLVMSGARQLIGPDPHATTRRPYNFMRVWQSITGDLVKKHGILLAPGGSQQGSVFISTRDAAQMMAGTVGHQNAFNRIIEAGGPEWITWAEVAELLAKKIDRNVRTLPIPAWFAGIGQSIVQPIMPFAANVLALVKFVAAWQPYWDSAPIVKEFNLPQQLTVAEYIELNWEKI